MNPWGGATLEWQTSSPPPTENFHGPVPRVGDPYDFERVVWDPAQRAFRHLPAAR
jgi:cytochrome c oxidase subunit 1